MLTDPQSLAPQRPAPGRPSSSAAIAVRSFLRRLALHAASLVAAVVAFAAYEHFKLQGASTPSMVALIAAALLALSPVRAVLHELLAVERKLLHAAHLLGGLALTGLTLGGAVSGRPVLDHVSLAPFAIMGAAQSFMHSPRNAEEGAALRRFVTSLPEVRRITTAGVPASAADVQQSIAVLTRIVGEAQELGEIELRADPAFQGALRRSTLRLGLALGLDTVDEAIGQLAANPAAASAVPEMRKRLAAARHSLDAEPGSDGKARRRSR